MTLHKTSKGDAFSLRSLRISAFSAFNGNFNAEGRRERRLPDRPFCAKPTLMKR